ncbi:hypothetical protein HDU87_002817 [Geranomyces variabilis]|uniref:Uncharacterized protein n=1 Tax=Geranomyces variabilis TaxID=109894 RepID=A0AAD5XRX0_9FUNG|nr:hypothetical protein HDU87_002817 [Geranomyces variabilis]
MPALPRPPRTLLQPSLRLASHAHSTTISRPRTLVTTPGAAPVANPTAVAADATATAVPPTAAQPAVVVRPVVPATPLQPTRTVPAFEPGPLHPPPPPPPKRPGFFRGGLLGFLTGLTLAGTTAYVYLVDDYGASTAQLLSGLEAVERSAAKVAADGARVRALETAFAEHVKRAATAKGVERVRAELLAVLDAQATQHLELRTRVWELEQDLKAARAVKK